MNEIIDRLLQSLTNLGDMLTSFLPKLFIAVVIFIIGWVVAKVLRSVLIKVLTKVQLDKLAEKMEIDTLLSRISKDFTLSKFFASIVYYFVLFVFLTLASDMLGLDMITNGVSAILAYIPKVIIAFVIFIIGYYIANIIKNGINAAASSIGISGAKIIANIVFYLLLIYVSITALNMAGVNTDIVTQNLTLIMGAVLLSFSISYAFASRPLVQNMLSSYYRKGKFVKGQVVKIDDVQGIIESIDNISVSIRTDESLVVLPCKILVENKVEIIEDVKFAE